MLRILSCAIFQGGARRVSDVVMLKLKLGVAD